MAITTLPDRVKLAPVFDVERMRADLDQITQRDFVYYDVIPLTRPTAKPGVTTTDYADGSWATWSHTTVLTDAPYLSEVVDFFRANTSVTLVRLLRLEPFAEVDEHCDPTLGLEQAKSVVRLTIPIISTDAVQFFLNDSVVPMQPGECWYLRLSDQHRIVNASDTVRVNMTIDMIPNEWVRSLILGDPADQVAAHM